jgi:PhzF family phenazine biosynthesis protein
LELDLGYRISPTEQHIPCFVIDSFADPEKNGTGNPAAVVVLEHGQLMQKNFLQQSTNLSYHHSILSKRAITWMQTVANEFNLSETAFVWPTDTCNSNDLQYYIKYFTPTIEVDLCGHATLASASVLFQECIRKNPTKQVTELGSINFHTVGGIVLETKLSSCDDKYGKYTELKMTFPTSPPIALDGEDDKTAALKMLSSALNIDTVSVIYLGITEDRGDLFVELTYDSFMQLPTLDIKFASFLEWSGYTRGIIVSCLVKPTDNENDITDFYSRFFGPKAGIDEDPVTGSAHCTLAPYYSNRLDGKHSIVGYQKSRRGGVIRCTLSDDRSQVTLSGTAVNTLQGRHCW